MIVYKGQQMTAKQFLRKFRKLDLLIDSMSNQLNDLKSKATKCTADISGSGGRSSGIGDRVGNNVVKYIDLQQKISAEWDEYIDMKTDIIAAIEKITDYDERLVLTLHYCEGLTFPRIAPKIHYCERSVKYLHGDALISFEKAFKSLHSFAPFNVL